MPKGIILIIILLVVLIGGLFLLSGLPTEQPLRTIETDVEQSANAQ